MKKGFQLLLVPGAVVKGGRETPWQTMPYPHDDDDDDDDGEDVDDVLLSRSAITHDMWKRSRSGQRK